MQNHLSRNQQQLRSRGPIGSRATTVCLEITRGQARQKTRQVAGPVFLIGAATDCDLVLGDPQFPEVHTYIFFTETDIVVRHLGDGPELTIDGRPIESVLLQDGHRMRTGPYEFQIHVKSVAGRLDGGHDRRPLYSPAIVSRYSG